MSEGALAILGRIQIVPVVTIDAADRADDLADALTAGGLGCAEITLRTDAGLDAIRAVSSRTDFLVGAGTVLTADEASRAVDAGARFLVSPGYDDDVVERAQTLGVPVIPGIATATELQRALRAGLDTVKIFPVEQLGGTAVLRSLSAPFPGVRLMPSGGVRRSNVVEYLDVPSVFAVGGSWMVPRDAVAAGDGETMRDLAADAVALLAGRGARGALQ